MRFIRIWTFIAVLCVGFSAAGCKEDPRDRARAAHAVENADEAEKALKEILASDPEDFEARRLMADVYRFRGEYQKTEEELQKLWDEKGFDDESKELPPEERAHRDLLENQFNELYAKWIEKIDPQKEPEKFEKTVQAGLTWNKKSVPLNRKLVEYYTARGEKLAAEGKKREAAEAYEQVLTLRAMPSQRTEAQQKATTLRKEAFQEEAQKRFEETVKPELVAAEQWDEEKGAVVMVIEADVDRGLRQNREADLAEARKQAAPTIRRSIAEMVQKMADVKPEIAAVTAVKMVSGDESLRRGTYKVTVTLEPADVMAGAFTAKEKARLAAEREAKKEAGAGEEQEQGADGLAAEAGDDAGGSDGADSGQ